MLEHEVTPVLKAPTCYLPTPLPRHMLSGMRKPLLLLSAVVVLFVGFILARTARYGSVPPPVVPAAEVAIPKPAAERLAGSLRFPTISSEDPAAFDA